MAGRERCAAEDCQDAKKLGPLVAQHLDSSAMTLVRHDQRFFCI